MLSLRTLGALDLTAADGRSLQSVLSQPRRAALLVYLAAARPFGSQRRDRLLSLFWPESDEASARHSLSEALYRLRRSLGRDAVEATGKSVLRLNDDVVRCDVRAFDRAVAERHWADALDLYRGEFLSGFHLRGAPGFERWLDAERERLREAAADMAWQLAAEQLHRGDVTEAERTAQRAVDLGPTDEEKVLAFMEALAAAGNRAAAIHFYERWAAALEAELELSPAPETEAAVRAIREGRAPAGPLASSVGAGGRKADNPPEPGPVTAPLARPVAHADTADPAPRTPVGAHSPRIGVGWRKLVVGVGVAAMLAVVLVAAPVWSPRTATPAALFDAMNVTGYLSYEWRPTWSPDGSALAFEAMEGGDADIWVTQLGTGQATNRTEDSPAWDSHPRWSPDGRWIAFFSGRPPGRGYYVMPAMGGEARIVVPGPDPEVLTATPAEWSPDASALAYALGQNGHDRWIEIRTLADGTTRRLNLPEQPRSNRVLDLRWSPDGRFLALQRARGAGMRTGELWLLRVSDGVGFRLTEGTHWDKSPSWSPDSRVLYFTSDRGGVLDLWRIGVGESGRAQGPPERVTVGMETFQAAIAPDGRRLAFVRGAEVENVFRAPLQAEHPVSWADVTELTHDATDLCCFDVRNGRLVIGSKRYGTYDLWVMPAEGGVPRPLTTDSALEGGVQWNLDGSEVAFHSTRSGHRQVWVMAADGGAARRLTHGEGEDILPAWSPTGTEIVLANERGLAVLSLANGTERQLTVGPDDDPAWSPDGRWVAFYSNRDGRSRIWRVPAVGGEPEPLSRTSGWAPTWSPDGAQVYFLGSWGDREARNKVWVLSLDGREERPVVVLEGRPGWLTAGLAVDEGCAYFGWGLFRADIWVADFRPPEGQ